MLSLALRNGYGIYEKTVLLSDRATWIKNMKDTYFYDTILILDFYCLCNNICTFAKEVFNNDENKYTNWSEDIIDLFRNIKSKEAIEIIKNIPKRQLKQINFDLSQYIDSKMDNIDYIIIKNKDVLWAVVQQRVEIRFIYNRG
jgi:hypothetical protein